MKLTAFAALPLVMLVISLTTFSSCKKDKDEPVVASLQTVSGSYKMGSFTYQSGTDPVEDVLQQFDACERDDVITLKTDKTFIANDVGVVCTPPGDYTGDWDVPNSTTFYLDGENWVIDSYDGKVLKISQSFTSGGITEVWKITMNKQ